MKIVCPGIVTSLAATPDGSYCIAGIAEKIHIWQVHISHVVILLLFVHVVVPIFR